MDDAVNAQAEVEGPSREREWTVGPAARLAGTTVRTLHHYDAIGLVRPSRRCASGYRTYTEADIDRVRRVLLYRELGLPLRKIARVMAGYDATGSRRATVALLKEQLAALHEQAHRLEHRMLAVQRELEAVEMGVKLTQEQKRALFGDNWVENEEAYAQEARTRWGQTEAWKVSQERTQHYSVKDWRSIQDEANDLLRRFAELLTRGDPPDGAAAVEVAEAHRVHLDRWFFPVNHQSHRALADMYGADPRFRAHFDDRQTGLAD